jgi:hypothetical protein
MPRRFVAVNVVLAALSAVLIAYIVRQLMTPTPLPAGGRRAAATTVAPATSEMPRPPAGAYTVVAARNLFSPTRTESPTSATTAAAAPLVRPNLFGIVVRESGSIAYLEDPVTKRVVGYRVGDKVVGGTVQTIKADSVVIVRPEGPVDVRLRDPGKPRTVATPGQPGAPPLGAMPPGTFAPAQPGQPAAVLPGVIPPAASPPALPPQVAQPQVPQPVPQPGVIPPGTQSPMIVPPAGARRPLPPNLLRRLPPGTGDAPQQ